VRRLGGLNEVIISVYAGGMTVRDIADHLEATLGTEGLGRDDLQHHRRGVRGDPHLAGPPVGPAVYPVIYLDAIMVKAPRRRARG
jgi:putative transposase